MYNGYTTGSLARRELARGGQHELEDMLQDVDEAAAMARQSRHSGNQHIINSLPRTFAPYRASNRVRTGEAILRGPFMHRRNIHNPFTFTSRSVSIALLAPIFSSCLCS